MKSSQISRRHSGFSMIELMVVIGIMVILAGLLIAALPGVMSRVTRGNVEAFIAELVSGLSSYQIDNGSYPVNEPSGDRDQSGIEGAAILYRHLSGDWDRDGRVDFANNEKVYVQKLDYTSNLGSKEPRSTSVAGDYMVIDSYSNPIRYLAQPPNLERNQSRKTRNPTYDIWSITDADPEDEQAEAKYITNW